MLGSVKWSRLLSSIKLRDSKQITDYYNQPLNFIKGKVNSKSEPTPTLPSSPRSCISCISLYLNCEYFTCMSPFRLQQNSDGEVKIARANYLQLALHTALFLLVAYWDLFFIHFAITEVNRSTRGSIVIKYFDLVNLITTFLWFLTMVNSLWREQSSFQKLHQLICQSSISQNPMRMLIIFIFLYIVHQSVVIFLLPARADIISNGSLSKMFNGFVFWGKSLTFESNISFANNTSHTNFSQYSYLECIQGFGTLITVLAVRSQEIQGYLLMLLSCILFWEACANFEKLFEHKEYPACVVVEKYYELKDLADTINKCVGPQIFMYVMNILVFLSTRFDSIFLGQDWISRVNFTFEFFEAMAILLFAAEGCKKIESFHDWLLRRENQGYFVDYDEQQWLMLDLQRKSVGIRGANRFTIDYTFLGNTLSLLITYFMIVVQSRDVLIVN